MVNGITETRAVQRDRRGVDQAFDEMNKSLDQLAGYVKELQSRLDAVLLPPSPQEAPPTGRVSVGCCNLAGALRSNSAQADDIASVVRDILQRLDV